MQELQREVPPLPAGNGMEPAVTTRGPVTLFDIPVYHPPELPGISPGTRQMIDELRKVVPWAPSNLWGFGGDNLGQLGAYQGGASLNDQSWMVPLPNLSDGVTIQAKLG
jgi:hypothetical protein